MTGYLTVKNWEKFQQYRDGRPTHWVKLHCSLLEDYDFAQLADKSKADLLLIWALAGRCCNEIPDDAKWIQSRTGLRNPPDIDVLVETGWLVRPYKDTLLQDTPSKTRQDKTRQEGVRTTSYEREFDAVWPTYPRKANKKGACRAYVATRGKGHDAASLEAAVKHYASVVDGKDPTYVLHGATFFGPNERWRDYVDAPKEADPYAGRLLTPSEVE